VRAQHNCTVDLAGKAAMYRTPTRPSSFLAFLQNTATLAHRDADGGAVHRIISGHLLMISV